MRLKTVAVDTPSPESLPRATSNQNRTAICKKVTALRINEEKGIELAAALSPHETNELRECEKILEKGLSTFFAVGSALVKIRESRLYRQTHRSFKLYCQERWNIGRSYAWRVMGASERMKLLPDDVTSPKPENEFQMRPFLKLPPEGFPGAWRQAIEKAKKGKITTSIVQAVLKDLIPVCQGQGRNGKNGNRRKSKARLQVGQVLVLLNEAKRQVEKGDTSDTIAVLERIESLLFER